MNNFSFKASMISGEYYLTLSKLSLQLYARVSIQAFKINCMSLIVYNYSARTRRVRIIFLMWTMPAIAAISDKFSDHRPNRSDITKKLLKWIFKSFAYLAQWFEEKMSHNIYMKHVHLPLRVELLIFLVTGGPVCVVLIFLRSPSWWKAIIPVPDSTFLRPQEGKAFLKYRRIIKK